ncbi:putative glycosyl transferase [Stanieria sp. NIES-3757]|nr:putative glycosyl transferase [Stanieria sp. NIES-3757]
MANYQPAVSIGIPVYNGENYLSKALDSLLNQTFTDFELIISDNASSDRTQAICLEYAAKDARIRYYRNDSNLGAADNYNRVFELSSGKYFKWAAHDDTCAPDYLEKCVEVLENNSDVVLAYPKAYLINEQDQITGIYTENIPITASKPHQRLYQLLETYGWFHGTQAFGLFRRNELAKTVLIGKYPQADRVLLAEVALLGKFAEVPEYLFYRRNHPKISQRANPNDESLSAWYDPKNKGKIMLPQWKRYSEYFHIISRTKLSWDEKILAYLQLSRRMCLSPGFRKRVNSIKEDLGKATKLFVMNLSRTNLTSSNSQ